MESRFARLVADHREQTLVFSLVFIVAFSSFRLSGLDSAIAHVEQWHNVANEMFYGQQDMLFSYGPLCWLTGRYIRPYNEWAYWLTLTFVSVTSALVWTTLFVLSYRARAVLLFAVSFFLFSNGLALGLAVLLLPLALMSHLEYSRPTVIEWGRSAWLVIGLLAGLCFYIRFIVGLVCAVSLLLYLLPASLVSRRFATLASLAGGTLLGYGLGGLLVFHQPSSLADYLFINNQLNVANSVDMTTGQANTPGSLAAVAIIGLLFTAYLLARHRALVLPIGFMMLVFFKWGFSRLEHHMEYFVVPMVMLSLIMLFDGSRSGRAVFCLVTALLFYLSAVPAFPGAVTKNRLLSGAEFAVPYAQRMKQAYAAFTLDAELVREVGQATVDVYPYKNEYVFANGLNYWHRPVFQNYMTLTPTLDAMNRDFLESAQRPAFILWTGGVFCLSIRCNVFEAFDEKYVLNEDPLTSSSLLLNYHVVRLAQGDRGEPVALLKANDRVRPASLHAATPFEMRFGVWYPVPQAVGGVVKLLPRFVFTLPGKLKNLLFRGSVVRVSYRLRSSEVRTYRLNLLNAGSGIWANPLIDRFDFTGEQVEAIMLQSSWSGYLQPVFKASWATLETDVVSARAVRYNAVTEPGPLSDEVLDCPGAIDTINQYSSLPARVEAQGSLVLRGWLAHSTDQGRLFDKVLVTLSDDSGRRIFVSTDRVSRPDLPGVFGKPELVDAGFRSTLDLRGYRGRYTLGLAGISDSRLYTCRQPEVEVQIR